MTPIRTLLCTLSVLSAVGARPQFSLSPSPVYSYRFAGPQQTKQESRDALGNIEGSYSVTYPDDGGTLTYSYSHRARPPAFRTLTDGPLGPAGTVVTFSKNSKDNAFLIEMLEQRIDSRDPPIVTKTDAVIIEALPDEALPEAPITSVRFTAGQKGQKTGQNQVGGGTLTRGSGFINSKESAFLGQIRQESLENEGLVGRNPPIITDEAVIVQALPSEEDI